MVCRFGQGTRSGARRYPLPTGFYHWPGWGTDDLMLNITRTVPLHPGRHAALKVAIAAASDDDDQDTCLKARSVGIRSASGTSIVGDHWALQVPHSERPLYGIQPVSISALGRTYDKRGNCATLIPRAGASDIGRLSDGFRNSPKRLKLRACPGSRTPTALETLPGTGVVIPGENRRVKPRYGIVAFHV